MKKFLCFVFSVLCLICFSGCGKQYIASADNLEESVASELSCIPNFENLDDETAKALSVVVRTKLKSSNENVDSNSSQVSSKSSSKISSNSSSKPSAKSIKIAEQTKGEVLSLSKTDANNIQIFDGQNDTWSVSVDKSNILSFLSKKNISLSNISKFEPEFDNNKNLINLSVAGQKISYEELEQEFGLKSSEITSVESGLTNITISGKTPKKYGYFDITEASQEAKNGKTYKQLLNHFYSS
jgi:hypothetical protein